MLPPLGLRACIARTGAGRIPLGVLMGTSRGRGTAALLSRALDILEDILGYIQARHRLSADEVEEFSSLLKIKLLENDSSVLRAYRGDSSLRTYLGVVANRLFLDYRRSLWGKWRPSAVARRLGTVGIEMEALLHRDRRTAADAVSVMAARHGGRIPKAALENLVEKLEPARPRRLDAPLEADAGLAAPVDSPVQRMEREEIAARITAGLDPILQELDPEDGLILQMHYRDGLPLATVARTLGLAQKRLYRRLERILEDLRAALESTGLRGPDVAEVLGRPDVELSFLGRFDKSGGNSAMGPSNESCGEDDTGRS